MSKTSDPWLWPPDSDVPATRCAAPIKVYRYDAADDADPFDELDNVECREVVAKLGPDPGHCVLQYRFGTGDPRAPADATEALDSAITRPKTIEPNDRIVVKATRPDGRAECLFDGLAVGFGLALDAGREAVRVTCVGIARRASDTPIRGALVRQGSAPAAAAPYATANVATDLTARFNPGGVGNCARVDPRVNVPGDDPTGGHWPFIDPTNAALRADHSTGVGAPGPWFLPDAIRYLLFYENKRPSALDSPYVANPLGADLDATLVAYQPLDPPVAGKAYDPAKPGTYTTADIVAPDTPITGRPWPAAVHDLISPHGFALAWQLETNADGTPRTTLALFHPQRSAPKSVYLQPRGSTYDPAYSNVAQAEITRDVDAAVNRWEVHGDHFEWEASFVLAQAFPAGDADLNKFRKAKDGFLDPTRLPYYRDFILDEAGEGHYPPGSGIEVTATAADLDALFGAPLTVGGVAAPRYAARRRPPVGELISTDRGTDDATSGTDPIGTPRRWALDLSVDYAPDASARLSTAAGAAPTGGSWTLSVAFAADQSDLATTAALAWNATAAAVQAAVCALPNVGTGNAVGTGGALPANDVILRFTGARASTPTTAFSLASDLTGAAGTAPAIKVAAQTAGKSAPVPGVWDGTGTWRPVAGGGWHLMADRVGVRYTGDDPNHVPIGAATTDYPTTIFPDGILPIIECLATPDDPSAAVVAHPKFWLRLTCVVKDDRRLKAIAGDDAATRLDGPLGDRVVTRVVDAHDRYKVRTVRYPSKFNDPPAGADLAYRDDTLAAGAEATQMQVTTVNGRTAGPITIPRFTRYYEVGDRIDQINGRGLSFRGDDGSDRTAAPWLPVVTEIRWQFGPDYQRTLLAIDDADAARGTVLRGRGGHRRGGAPGHG